MVRTKRTRTSFGRAVPGALCRARCAGRAVPGALCRARCASGGRKAGILKSLSPWNPNSPESGVLKNRDTLM